MYRVATAVTNVYTLYSVGRMNDVAECVASYQVLEPSDGTMDKNAFYYKSKTKIPEEKFVPRPVSIVYVTHVHTHTRTHTHHIHTLIFLLIFRRWSDCTMNIRWIYT